MAEVLFWKLKGSLDYYWRGVGVFTPIANPLHAVIKAKNFVWNTDLYRIYRLLFFSAFFGSGTRFCQDLETKLQTDVSGPR